MADNQHQQSNTRRFRPITEVRQIENLFGEAVRKNLASGQEIYDAVLNAKDWLWKILKRQRRNSEMSLEQRAELLNALSDIQYQGRVPNSTKTPVEKQVPVTSKPNSPLPVTRRVNPTPRKQTPQRTGAEGFAAKYGSKARLPVLGSKV